MEQNLFVLLGDVIASRQLKNREKFQNSLIESCESINNKYKPDIYANFNIIKGSDEIGAVLRNISNLYDMILTISDEIGSDAMRYVLVKDKIDTGLDQREISRMDGPAFHRASNLMLTLKKEKSIFKMSTGDEIFDKLVTNNINLIYLLKRKWSAKKTKIIKEYEKTKDQKEVAKELGIKQQGVSYHIHSSHWNEIKLIENNLKEAIRMHEK